MKFSLPVVFALVSAILYGSQSYVLEQKLSPYNPYAVLVSLYAVMTVIVVGILISLKASGKPIAWPVNGWDWKMIGLIAVSGVIFFLADGFMVTAYAESKAKGGASLHEIVAMTALIPVFASIMKYVWTQKAPNRWHVASYVLVAGVLWLAGKGAELETKRETAKAPTPDSVSEPRP